MRRAPSSQEIQDTLAFVNHVRSFNGDQPLTSLPPYRAGMTPGVDILYRAIGRQCKASMLSVKWKGPYGWIETEIPTTISGFLRQT